jgi:hypothetical protein
MGPDMVIVFHPLSHDDLGFPQAVEDFSIQKIISKGTVKAFTKAILPRATGFNVGCLYSNTR